MINDCDEVVAIFTSSTKTSDTPDPPGRAGPPRPADLSPAAWMVQAWMSQLSLDLFFAHIDCALRRGRPTSLTSKINKRHFFFCPLSRRWRQVGGPRRVSPTIFPPTSDTRDPLGRPVANGRAKCKEIGWSLRGRGIFLVIFARITGF